MSITRHTGYNLVGALLPLVIALITVPLYLRVIGAERYGLMSICWLLLGYFGLFDFGISRAVSQRIASLRDRPSAERSETFWTGLFLTLALGAISVPLVLPLARAALAWIELPAGSLHGEIDRAVPWLAAVVPVSLLGALLNGTLTGRERFGVLNVIEGVTNMLLSLVPLALGWWVGPDLWILLAGSLAAKLLSIAIMGFACVAAVPIGPPRPRRALVGQLAGYGGWVSITSIVGPLLSLWDRFAIGAVIGAKAITVYVIPFSLVYRLIMVPAALTSALFPRFAAASQAELERLSLTAAISVSVVMTPMVLAAIMAIGPFFDLWLGAEIGPPAANVAYILLPGIWANSLGMVALAILQGQGKPRYVALTHLSEALPYAVLLYAGLLLLGLEGAALASSLRMAVDALVLMSFARLPLRQLRPLLIPAALVTAAGTTALLMPPGLWRWLILALLLVAGSVDSFRRRPEALDQLARLALTRLRGATRA